MRFQSIIGSGVVSEVTEIDEKKRGPSLIMDHYTENHNWDFNKKMTEGVMVFKLQALKMSCKEHK